MSTFLSNPFSSVPDTFIIALCFRTVIPCSGYFRLKFYQRKLEDIVSIICSNGKVQVVFVGYNSYTDNCFVAIWMRFSNSGFANNELNYLLTLYVKHVSFINYDF